MKRIGLLVMLVLAAGGIIFCVRARAEPEPPAKLSAADFSALKEALLSISNVRLKYEAQIARESAPHEVKRNAILEKYKVSAEEIDKGVQITPEGGIERTPAPAAIAAPPAAKAAATSAPPSSTPPKK